MSNVWGRLTGPIGDRAIPQAHAAMPAYGVITLTSPHVRYDTSWSEPACWRTWDGLVVMQGLIRRSDNASIAQGTIIGYVPFGFRPADRTLLATVCNSADGIQLFTRLDVDPNGALTLQVGTSNVWFSLSAWWYVPQPGETGH
jgi:hypothetical protein